MEDRASNEVNSTPQGPAGPTPMGPPMGGPRPGGFRGPGGPRRPGGRDRRFFPRRRVCQFCVDRNLKVDYKDVMRMQQCISDRGKIYSRRRLGTCAKHQRAVATAIKRARHMALLPFTSEHSRTGPVL